MTKKKKVTRGNPAANSVAIEKKPRGGWKPSTSVGSSSVAPKPAKRRNKFNWKKAFVLSVVVILAGVFVITTVLSTVPVFPEAPAPYNAPNVVQGS